MIERKNIPKILIFALLAFLLSETLLLCKNKQIRPEAVATRVQNIFQSTDQLLKDWIDFLLEKKPEHIPFIFSNPEKVSSFETKFESDGIALFVYSNDSLLFWSNNLIPFNNEGIQLKDKGVLLLENGWYFYRNVWNNEFNIIGLSQIYSLYKYQNRFLVNDFHSGLNQSNGVFVVSDKGDAIGYRVLDSEGDFAFSLISRRGNGLKHTRGHIVFLSIVLSILSISLVFIFGFKLSLRFIKNGNLTKGLIYFVMIVMGIRVFIFIGGLPSAFYLSRLFSPEFYASSQFLPSLGDLLFNVLVFGLIGFFLYRIQFDIKKKFEHLLTGIVFSFSGLFVLGVLCQQALGVMKGLVLNSQLNLGVGFIFDFSLYNVIGFLIIAILFFSVFFYSQVILRFVLTLVNNSKTFWVSLVLFCVVFGFADFVGKGPNCLLWFFFGSTILLFFLENIKIFDKSGLAPVFVAFFLFSIISTVALLQFNHQKSQQQRKSLALSLSSDQDHLAEFLFLEIEESLFNDHQLKNLVISNPLDETSVFRYLQHHYFYDFWEKYEIQVTICKPGETRLFLPFNFETVIDEYFESLIAEFGRPSLSENLFFLDNNYYPGRKSYISWIPIEVNIPGALEEKYLVYLEFNTKFGVRESGLPELLVDDNADVYRGFEELSYAKYINGKLVHKIGNFVYSFDLSVYGEFLEEFTFFDIDHHEHLIYKKSEDFHLLISKPKNSFLENIAPFSYMFILMFLISFFLSREKLSGWLQMTFKRRVQFYMLGLVAFAVISIGIVSSLFLVKIYEQKNIDIVNEKSQSVLYDLQSVFGSQEPLSERYDYFVYEELLRINRVFFTDINVFSPGGALVATSRPRVFEDGLIGAYMNPVAFSYLQSQQKGQFAHNEKIGNLQFVSSYIPLHNNNGELIGYINLPYFAKQSQLRNEISLFVLAFVNIITILLMIALVAALLASSYVTAPLQLIRDNISRIQLGKTNQKLQWKRNDEIGQLVMEYNRMIDEIEQSAELLAKSERESAWRDMAKQVAHEIKNPLTPMRLSIQHLEKAYHDKMPDWDKRLERFSKTMIEQIDNLSVIAGEFSNFAKMPVGNKFEIDLKEFVPEILELFNNNENVAVNLEFGLYERPIMVFADKNQLTRVFNNLVNNAIQAYPKDKKAQVFIRFEVEEKLVMCSVTDHGTGIPDHAKRNIFRPYFTTKTGGMGLGLSMVKSIIENHGGQVFFDSKEGEYTIFSFTLPIL